MTRPRGVALAAWLAGVALCVLQLAHTRFIADLSSFLPASPTREERLLVDQLREGAVTRIVLIGVEGANPAARAALSRSLGQALRADPLFASASNGSSAGFEREMQFVLEHRYALSPDVAPQRFTVAGLRAAVTETIDLLASPAGLLVKRLAARDPTGETLAAMQALRPAVAPRSEDGVWVSADGRRALLLARTRAGASDIDAQARAAARIEDAFRQAVARAGPEAAGARLVMTGAGVFSARSRALIEHEVVRLTTWSALLVAALLLAVYRSIAVLGFGLVPVVSGAIAGVAAVSLGFGAVHGVTLGFGTTLIGEAVDYAIYYFVQVEGGGGIGPREFWPTIRLGVLTSIAGFAALVFSGLPGLAQLGVYSIVGLAVAATVTRFVLPALSSRRLRIRDLGALGRRFEGLARQAARLRIAVGFLALASIAVLAARHATLWDAEIASLSPIAPSDRALDAELRSGLGAADTRYLVVATSSSEQGALEAAERLAIPLDALTAKGVIAGYESPARILPSIATQRARLQSLPEPVALRAALREALAGLPLRADKLEPFVADVARARSSAPLARADLAGTAFESWLDGSLFRAADGTWTALLSLHPAAQAAGLDARAVQEAIASSATRGAVFLDLKAEVDRLYAGYFHRALAASAAGLAAIVALLYAALRRTRRVAGVLAPLVAAVLVVAAGHALAGTQMTLMHLVGLLLVVAIGSNYGLFFDRIAESPGDDPARTLASLVVANATTVIAFGILSLSEIPLLRAIGGTVAPGTLVALAFTAATCARYNRPGER